MLEIMRKLANHFIFKALLIIVVLSFVIWGISDVFKKGYGNVIATIDSKYHINMVEYQNMRNNEIKKIEKAYNQKIDDLSVKQISAMILNQMIDRKLFEIEAEELGIMVSDAEVLDYVKSISLFQNEKKDFDNDKFKQFLIATNLTESEYVKTVKKELAINFFIEILERQHIDGALLSDAFHSYLNQERMVDIITIDSNKLQTKPKASQEELMKFYEDNIKNFSNPQLRSFSYIEVKPEIFAKEIKITNEQIKKEFEDSYSADSKIRLKDVYKEIKDRLYNVELEKQLYDLSEVIDEEISSGADIDEISNKFALNVKKVTAVDNLGFDVNGKPIIDDKNLQLIQTIYTNDELGQLNLVMKNDEVGLYIVKLDDIIPQAPKPFAQVEKKVNSAWLKEELVKIAMDEAVKLKADFDSGKNLDDLIENYELKKHIKTSRNSDLPYNLIKNIFEIKPSQMTNPIKDNDKAILAILRSIHNQNIDRKSLNFIEISERVNSNLKNQTLEEYVKYLRKKHEIKIVGRVF